MSRPRRVRRRLAPVVLPLLLLTLLRGDAAALVRPWEAAGDFQAQLDVYDRERLDGAVDVLALISIPNTQLAFRQAWGEGLQGRLLSRLELITEAGETFARTDTLELRALRREDARAPNLYQVFSLDLKGVRGPYGTLTCTLEDLAWNRSGDGRTLRAPRTVIEGAWVRAESLDDVRGLYLHPPVFLSGAPRALLPEAGSVAPPRRRILAEHLHPNRRYGLEQETLQVAFDIERGRYGDHGPDDVPATLMMQVLARDLDFVHRDTLRVVEDPRAFAARGGLAAVTWEMDVNALPPGAYQLSCGPLDGFGNSWVTEFDVIWSPEAMARPAPDLWLQGNLVLADKELEEFRAAGPAEQEALLAQFWSRHDPDPSTRFNEAEHEFRRRMRHVERYLGGFGRSRALDDRGYIYLLLGEPDERSQEVVPRDTESFDSAVEQVYDRWSPLRFGSWDRPLHDAAQSNTLQADRERRERLQSMDRYKGWELWTYQNKGESLFPNAYSDTALGLRFMFVARLAESVYTLDNTNAHDRGVSNQ